MGESLMGIADPSVNGQWFQRSKTDSNSHWLSATTTRPQVSS